MNRDRETLEEQLAIAPVEIKKYIAEDRWASVVSEIAQKNNLSPEQKISLENEVLFVLIGLEFVGDFRENIKREVSLPDLLVKDLDLEIQEKIFKEVKDWLPNEKEGDEAVKIPTQPLSEPINQYAARIELAKPPLEESSPQSSAPKKTIGIPIPPLPPEKKWWEQPTRQSPSTQNALVQEATPPSTQPQNKSDDLVPYREGLPAPQKFGIIEPKDRIGVLNTVPQNENAGAVEVKTDLEKKLSAALDSKNGGEITKSAYPTGNDPYREPLK